MALNGTQMGFDEVDEEYAAFVNKFKPKKTTDDCYTPKEVYEAVAEWVSEEYGVDRDDMVRPFWPGGDYERYEYPEGCCVVDNPPFSILARICRFYLEHGVRFFLFAPYLTSFSIKDDGLCRIPTDCKITYENGAVVNTAFVTNMDECIVRSCPDLRKAVQDAADRGRRSRSKERPKYVYPSCILTATMVGRFGKYGIDYRLKAGDAAFVSRLDSQRAYGTSIFGNGLLLSEKAAAEKAAAEKAAAENSGLGGAVKVWELSDREEKMRRMLG